MGEEETEEDKLQAALAQAVRPAPRGELESLLASELATAIFSPPLEKIRHVLEAYLLLPSKDKEALFPDEWERDELCKLYEVCISLERIVEINPPSPWHREPCAKVPWSFSGDRAHIYLSLFRTRIFFFKGKGWDEFFKERNYEYWLKKKKAYTRRKRKKRVEKPYLGTADLTPEQHYKTWVDLYLHNFAVCLSDGTANLSMVEMVKNEFIVSVMPHILQLLRTIHNRYVSQDVWERTLQIFKGKKVDVQP